MTLFGGRDGECVEDHAPVYVGSGCGVGGVYGIGGGFGRTDILFILRASVGLIVRAPRPVACALPGMIDSLFADDGVFVR